MSVLVGKQAPDFTVPAVLADGQIVDSYNFFEAISGKYAVIFFYPLDFTFVCPSELHQPDRGHAPGNRAVLAVERNLQTSTDRHPIDGGQG